MLANQKRVFWVNYHLITKRVVIEHSYVFIVVQPAPVVISVIIVSVNLHAALERFYECHGS